MTAGPARRRRALVVLLATCAAVVLAGCGGLPLPTSTTSVRGVSVGQAPQDADVPRRIPRGPESDATPTSLVQGYLQAGADADVARGFLTPGNGWDPLALTTVFTGDPTVSVDIRGERATAVASISTQLTIGEDGSTRPGGVSSVRLHLIQVQGSWRIADPPQGTILPAADLPSEFRQARIAWLSSDRRSLVGESVLLPGDAESVIPTVVRTLLRGPLSRLVAAGVTTDLPTRLSVVRAVQIGSEVDIDLAGRPGVIVGSDGLGARAQVAATVLSLPGVSAVRVDLSGQPLLLNVSGSDTPITAADTAGFDRDVVPGAVTAVRASGASLLPLRTTRGPDAVPATPSASPTPAASPRSTPRAGRSVAPTALPSVSPVPAVDRLGAVTALAVAADGVRVAELRSTRSGTVPYALLTPDAEPVAVAPAGPWTSIAWGPSSLWLVRGGSVLVAVRDAAPVAATVMSSTGTTPAAANAVPLRSLQIEPDGVHAIGVTATGGDLVAGLVNAGASPPTLTDVHGIAPSLSTVTALAFSGAGPDGGQLLAAGVNRAGALADGSGGSPPVTGLWQVGTGAPDLDLGELSPTVTSVPPPCPSKRTLLSLTALPAHPALANCDDGRVRQLAGTGWAVVGQGLAAYPLD